MGFPKKKNLIRVMSAILIGLGFLLLTGLAIAVFGAVVINRAIAESKDLDV